MSTITYQADTITTNGKTFPAQYYLDSETTAVIIRVELQGKTATITLHSDHPDYNRAAEALRQQDALEESEIPSFEQARANWEAEHTEELTQKREARAAFLAAKQARKEAKPLPEWAGQSIEGNGFSVKFDTFHRDTMVIFDTVPLPAVRKLVKASGFYWSPTKGAWVRGLNGKAKRAAEDLAIKLAGMKLYASTAKRPRIAR